MLPHSTTGSHPPVGVLDLLISQHAHPQSRPTSHCAAQEEGLAECADDDVLKQPAQRVPSDLAEDDAADAHPESCENGLVHENGDDNGSRLAPVTPDLDEDMQQAAAPGGYVSRENRTPYMERKIRDLRVRRPWHSLLALMLLSTALAPQSCCGIGSISLDQARPVRLDQECSTMRSAQS